MALKSTIFKVNLQIADIDHSYYADHALTLARHPSETDERMMIRLAAMAFNAYKLQSECNGDGVLAFGAGLSDVEDPDVSLTDFTGHKRLWIEVGQPEDKPISKACNKADAVMLFFLFPPDELRRLFEQLGYAHDSQMARRTVEYYDQRTSHGSTLSLITHAGVLAALDPESSWERFMAAPG